MQSKDLQMKIKQACNDVDINDCICSACRLKYLKKLKSSTYTPEKTRKIDRNPCFLTNFFKCSDLSERDNQCQIESFNSAFSLQCVLIPTTCTIPLCMRHRRDLSRYEEAQGLSKCSVCEGLLKLDSKKYSSSVLSEGDVKDLCFINENFCIRSDSILCQSCYSYARRNSTRSKKQSFEELEKTYVKCSAIMDESTLDYVMLRNSETVHQIF